MNKQDYFKKSRDQDLPARCPILERCKRRAWTIYQFSNMSEDNRKRIDPFEFLVEAGDCSKEILENPIEMIGESLPILKGDGWYSFSCICPEVSLFDTSHSITHTKEAVTSASWDKYNKNGDWKIRDYGHYSECTEFSNYIFNQSFLKKDDSKSSPIPLKSSFNDKKLELKKLIGNDKLDRFFEKLDNEFNKSSDKYDDFILLKARFIGWNRAKNQNTTENNIEIDKLRKAILDFCKDIEESDLLFN